MAVWRVWNMSCSTWNNFGVVKRLGVSRGFAVSYWSCKEFFCAEFGLVVIHFSGGAAYSKNAICAAFDS